MGVGHPRVATSEGGWSETSTRVRKDFPRTLRVEVQLVCPFVPRGQVGLSPRVVSAVSDGLLVLWLTW